MSAKQSAVAIRKDLRNVFPATIFSVTIGRGSGVDSVRVRWTDGPTVKLVESHLGKYERGHFDGMTDSYDYSNRRDDVPQTRYLFTSRDISPTLANRCIRQIAAFWGGVDSVPEAVPGYFGHMLEPAVEDKLVRADLNRTRDNWGCSIRRAAENATEFAGELVR